MDNPVYIDITHFFFAIALMLISGCLMGYFTKKLNYSTFVGELLAGIILGPTVLGYFFPMFYHRFYNAAGISKVLGGLFELAVVFLLFIAGMEVEWSLIRKNIKITIFTTVIGFCIPFVSGFIVTWYFSSLFIHDKTLVFALFMGVACSISALPVIAGILIRLRMIKTKVGVIIMSSAMLTDIVGWIIFSIILELDKNQIVESSFMLDIVTNLSMLLLMCVILQFFSKKLLLWFYQKHLSKQFLLPLILFFTLLSAGFTELIHLHVALGAFIAGIIIGPILTIDLEIKEAFTLFTMNFFAPLFFISIGLKCNFLTDFDLLTTIIIILLACTSKIIGSSLGAFLGGISLKKALQVGFGLNVRGAMEIILGMIALNTGLITPSIFIALVIMAILTSAASPYILCYLNNTIDKISKDVLNLQ
jgi:Kef-type K+ transport system membrane component KefB